MRGYQLPKESIITQKTERDDLLTYQQQQCIAPFCLCYWAQVEALWNVLRCNHCQQVMWSEQ